VNALPRRCDIAHCAKDYRVPAAWECRLHWLHWHCSQVPGFKSGGLRHLEPYRQRDYHATSAGSLTPWSFKAGDRAGVTRTAMALHWSQHRIMETSFAVHRGSDWRTHWTHVSLTVWTVKSLFVTDIVLNFWSRPTARLPLQIISLNQPCWYRWRPLASYAFIKIMDKIKPGAREPFFNRGVTVKNHLFDISEVSIFWPQSQILGGQLTPLTRTSRAPG